MIRVTKGYETMQYFMNHIEDKNRTLPLSHSNLYLGALQVEQETNNKVLAIIPSRGVSPKLFNLIKTPSEMKLIDKISQSLKANNALFVFDHQKVSGRSKLAFLSLVKKRIILRTEFKTLHIVNPVALRFGAIHKVIVCTAALLRSVEKHTDVNRLIKNLKADPKYQADLFYRDYDNLLSVQYVSDFI